MRKSIMMVAVLCCMTVAVFVGCAKKAGSGADALALVPSTVAVVGQMDIAKMMTIEALKEQIEEGEADPQMAALIKAGVAPANVSKVTFGASKAAGSEAPELLVIVEMSAPLVEADVIAALEAEELVEKADPIGGKNVYLLKDTDAPVDMLNVFLSDTMVAAGTKSMIEAAIALQAGTGSAVKANAELSAVCGKGSKDGMIWAAAVIPADLAKEMGGMAQGAPVKPEQIKSIFLGADYGDAAGLKIDVNAAMDTAETVTALMPQLEAAKGMVGMMSEGKLSADMITIAADGANLKISIAIPKAVIDEMTEKAEEAVEETVEEMVEEMPAVPVE